MKIEFKEHNNRKKANKFAEYITGEVLRRYVAEKVQISRQRKRVKTYKEAREWAFFNSEIMLKDGLNEI